MPYELRFKPKALKEWSRLDKSVKERFKKKLQERLENPHVPKDRVRGYADVYKIKLRSAGYRLAYQVNDMQIVVLVLKRGRRDRIYDELKRSES
jgi:mRNA interferase RelE/StbE